MTDYRIGDRLAASLVQSLASDCGAAAALARSLLEAGPARAIDASVIASFTRRSIRRVTDDFERRGWLVREQQSRMIATISLPHAVADFLEGAASMHRSFPSDGGASAAVTMPIAPSAIGRTLPLLGVSHASLQPTSAALERVARAATRSFTVMTPFLNREGLAAALDLFRLTPAPLRVLVIRRSGMAREAARDARSELETAAISVLDYTLPAGDGYETFHAKVVLADEHLAYVGSANMTVYSRHSMELGIVVDGRAAHVVATVVRAVERIALPLGP